MSDKTIEPAKLYCPYCDLQLAANGSHIDNVEAWEIYCCEYYIDAPWSKRTPVKEIDRIREGMKDANKRRNAINKGIRSSKARVAELEVLEKADVSKPDNHNAVD